MAKINYVTELVEEKAVARVQAMALRLLRGKKMSRADLAHLMEVSPAHISQLLGDEPKNLSVRKAARMFHHLGEELIFTCKGIEKLDAEAEARNAQVAAALQDQSSYSEWCTVSANGNSVGDDCPPVRALVAA